MGKGVKGFVSWVAVSAALAFGSGARAAAFNDTQGEGKAMVEELLARMPAENTEIMGLLKMRPETGPQVEVPIRMIIRIGTNAWNEVYETQPVNGRPGEILLVQHHAGQPNQYLHTQFTEKPKEPAFKKIEGAALYQPFAGSDFFPADLGLEFLHWPSQKVVKKEMRKSRSCRVVESTNPNPKAGGYSRVLSWLDFETGNIVMAEGYDAENKKLKEFSVRKISRSEGKAQLKMIEMRNDQTDARTQLEFNLEIEEK